MSKVLKLAPGEILINEDDEKTDLYWVQSGELAAIQKRKHYEVHLDHIRAGELIGEMSMIDKKPRSATIQAVTECEVIQFSTDEIYTIFESQPKIIQTLLQTLVERLRKTNARINKS